MVVSVDALGLSSLAPHAGCCWSERGGFARRPRWPPLVEANDLLGICSQPFIVIQPIQNRQRPLYVASRCQRPKMISLAQADSAWALNSSTSLFMLRPQLRARALSRSALKPPAGKPRLVSTSTRNSPCGDFRSNTTLAGRGSRIPTIFPSRFGTSPLCLTLGRWLERRAGLKCRAQHRLTGE